MGKISRVSELRGLSGGGTGGRARRDNSTYVETRWNFDDDDSSVSVLFDEDSLASEESSVYEYDSYASEDDGSGDDDECNLPGNDDVEGGGGMMAGDHVIIPYKELIGFMQNFVCVECHEGVALLKKQTIGIATSVTSECICGKTSQICAEKVLPPDGAVNDGNYLRRVSAYALNVRLVLLSHLIGGSRTAAMTVCGLLAVSSSLFKNSWATCEDTLGEYVRSITDGIVNNNIKEELLGIQPNSKGMYEVDGSGDGAWQTGGRSFNSISGQCMFVGKRFEKVIAYANYAKHCRKCDSATKSGGFPPAHNCPKNYEGSSKGMECYGLMECVLKLHTEHNICVCKFVLDDDSTTRAYLRHSFQESIDSGLMKLADWPRTADGKSKKKDNGKLPLTHSVIEFIADINHRVRTFGGHLWKLKKLGKKNETEQRRLSAFETELFVLGLAVQREVS